MREPDRDPQRHLPLTPLSFEILLSLADRPRHGYGIIKEVEERSGQAFASSTGTLYLAIQRLHKNELLAVVPTPGGKGSRGRTYELTELGRQVAAAEARRLAARVRDAQRKALLADEAPADAGRARG